MSHSGYESAPDARITSQSVYKGLYEVPRTVSRIRLFVRHGNNKYTIHIQVGGWLEYIYKMYRAASKSQFGLTHLNRIPFQHKSMDCFWERDHSKSDAEQVKMVFIWSSKLTSSSILIKACRPEVCSHLHSHIHSRKTYPKQKKNLLNWKNWLLATWEYTYLQFCYKRMLQISNYSFTAVSTTCNTPLFFLLKYQWMTQNSFQYSQCVGPTKKTLSHLQDSFLFD